MISLAASVLHPSLLWGLPLVAVPVLLHLLFRQRAQHRPWAAIEMLRRAIEKTRRRRRLEQWLVLTLRTLAMLCLVLFVARPSTEAELGSASLHQVLVLDDSRSMELLGDEGSLFDEQRELLIARIESMIERDAAETLTVLCTSSPDRPLAQGLPIQSESVRDLLEQLRDLETQPVTASTADLVHSLEQVLDTVAETENRVTWFSDFRSLDWLAAAPEGSKSPLDGFLDPAAEPARRLVIRTSSRPLAQNLGVVDLRCDSRRLVAGVPLRLTATIRNHGPDGFEGGPLAVELDGLRDRPVELPRIGVGEEIEVSLRVRFDDRGGHGVTVRLPEDRYRPDDSRHLALQLTGATPVLLVDGEPTERPSEAESWMVRAAFDPAGSAVSGVDLTLADRDRLESFTQADFDRYDLVVFCDVRDLTVPTRARLRSYVDAGGGVLVFTGDRCDPATLQSDFFLGETALLEVRALANEYQPDDPLAVDLGEPVHEMFAEDEDLWRRIFGGLIRVAGWTRFDLEGSPGLEVPLRIQNPRRDPLLFGRVGTGTGSVFVCATSADGSWNNLGAHPGLLVIAQEMLATAVRVPVDGTGALAAGDSLEFEVDLGRFEPDVTLRRYPDASIVVSEAVIPSAIDTQTADWKLPAARFGESGLFELGLRSHSGDSESRLLARNPDAREGDLNTATELELRRRLSPESSARLEIVGVDEDLANTALGSSGPWRLLVGLCLTFLVAETFLCSRHGRRLS